MPPYNKLVRDKIPEIIAASGRAYGVRQLLPEEFDMALRTKLIEEATEIQDATADNLVGELADLQEVVDALMELHGIRSGDVQFEQIKKRDERGRFSEKMLLLWTE